MHDYRLNLDLNRIFPQEPLVLAESAHSVTVRGTRNGQIVCLACVSGDDPLFPDRIGPAARGGRLTILVVQGGSPLTHRLALDVPLVVVVDEPSIDVAAMVSFCQADLIVATERAPSEIRRSADVLCVDLDHALGLMGGFLDAFGPEPPTEHDPCRHDVLELVPADPERPYAVRPLLEAVCGGGVVPFSDDGALFRGVGRVSGQAVAILASNADRDGGRLCENDCRNAARLLRFANRFQIPVLAVQDSIGVEGSEGFADAFDELLGEWMHLTVPAITLIVGRAYGLAHVALGGTGAKPSAILAWPRARVSLDVPEGDDPRSAAIAVARGFGVHEIIDPRRTRETVGEWLSLWQDRSAG